MISRFKSVAPRLFPVLLLLLTILLLTIILASLGRQSLERERELLLNLKEKQAEVMTRSIASASRISAMMPGSGDLQLKRFVSDAADDENVVFISVYNHLGELIAGSPGFQQEEHGLLVTEIRARLGDSDRTFSMEEFPGYGRLYLFVGSFLPIDSSWIHVRMLELPPIPGVTEDVDLDTGADRVYYSLIGMRVDDLDKAVSKGVRQTLLNGFLLLLLGTIGFYFLILAQGYYSTRRALFEIRQYTLDVIDGMAEGLVNVDTDGTLRTINPEAEQMLGIKARDALGSHWSILFSGDDWSLVSEYLDRGLPFYDLEVAPGDSSRPYLMVTTIPVRGQGGMVMFLRDMAEVKGLQAEVRRSESLAALGRLVAGMAHEIRNPLNSIRGFSQHLQARFSPDTQERNALDVIVREVDRLNRVITELLEFSRPRDPRMDKIDINDVVRNTLALVEREASNQGVTCETDLAVSSVDLKGDMDTLRQLLLNLVLNALQAMPDGGILTVSTLSELGKVSLSVSDTGWGMPEEDLDQIFEPFFTRRDEGTGLGLSIVHRIVQDHGGEIRVESSPGNGSVFTVKFPST